MKKYYKVLLLLPLLVGCFPADVFGQWSVKFPGQVNTSDNASRQKVVEATDGNILVIANVLDSAENLTVTKLCKFNKNNGQLIWQKSFNYYPANQLRNYGLGTFQKDLLQAPNGNIYISLRIQQYAPNSVVLSYSSKIIGLDTRSLIIQTYVDTLNTTAHSRAFDFRDLSFYDNTVWAVRDPASGSLDCVRFNSYLQNYQTIVPNIAPSGAIYFFNDSSIYINQLDIRLSLLENQRIVQYNLLGDSIGSKLRGRSTIIKRDNIYYGIHPAIGTGASFIDSLHKMNNQFMSRLWSYQYNLLNGGISNWNVRAAEPLGHTIDRDGGIYIWGYFYNNSGGGTFASINKVNTNGAIEWQYNYNSNYLNMDRVLSLISTDEGVVAVGDNTFGELWVAKLNGWGLLDATHEVAQQKEVFKLYPNPIVDLATLEFENSISGLAEIYSSDGRKIKSFVVNNENIVKLNLGDISKGIYYLVLIDDKTKKTYRKAFAKL
jgi:hypothetical protein